MESIADSKKGEYLKRINKSTDTYLEVIPAAYICATIITPKAKNLLRGGYKPPHRRGTKKTEYLYGLGVLP